MLAKLNIEEYGFSVIEFYTETFPCCSEATLHKWWSCRQTPYNSGYVADVYKAFNIRTLCDFVPCTAFTSVNDCFWVKTSDTQSWGSVNLFDNHFTDVVKDICMGNFNTKHLANDFLYAPELTGGGSFPKIFRHRGNEIYCLKGNKVLEGKEFKNSFIYSEVLMTQLYDYLGIKHISYNLAKYKELDVCCSKVATNKNVEYYPAVYFLQGYPSYEEVKVLFENYELFYIMLLIDCIVFNKDRHTGNYGYLISSNTHEVVDFFPLYDNNYALFSDIAIMNINLKKSYLLNKIIYSRLNSESFISLAVKVLRDYNNGLVILDKLKDFKFKPVGNINRKRLHYINVIIQNQIRLIESYYRRLKS
jgi:hypothetical protein